MYAAPALDTAPVLPWMLHPDALAALYDYWLSQDLGSAVPRWHPLDRNEVAPWLGSLFTRRFPAPAWEEIRRGGVGGKIMRRLGFDPGERRPENPTRLFMERSYLQARRD